MLDVPLRGKREIVAAALLEVALFPTAAVDKGDLIEAEGADWIGTCKVPEHSLRVQLGIADDVGHARLAPTVVCLFVAGLAGSRTDERL
jgi:hypothetical protein